MKLQGKILVGALCLVILMVSTPSYANQNQIVLKLMEIARENLSKAKLPDGSFVPPETEEQKKTPLIPFNDAKRVVENGQLSAVAAWCRIEWKNNYLAFMNRERAKKAWSDKQLAYIGLLHGIAMGVFENATKEKGACPPEQATHVREIMSKM